MANRPQGICDYIGQERVKEQLKITMGACMRSGKQLPHILLSGNAGLGKTTLARIIANEFHVGFHEVMASNVNCVEDIESVLVQVTSDDKPNILFIDEIHRLQMRIEELLYPVMEDFVFEKEIIANGRKQMQRFWIPKFTIVGATTLAGTLSRPLRDRFGLHFQLQNYQQNEVSRIIERLAERESVSITNGAVQEISLRSKGVARIAINYFSRCREYAEYMGNANEINHEVAQSQFSLMGIDAMGLDENDYRILQFLASQSRPVGLRALASGTDIDEATIENMIEPYLVQRGLVQRSRSGREITTRGTEWLIQNSVETVTIQPIVENYTQVSATPRLGSL